MDFQKAMASAIHPFRFPKGLELDDLPDAEDVEDEAVTNVEGRGKNEEIQTKQI